MKEQYQTINDLARRAKTNKEDKDYLYAMFRPLMFATAHKYCNQGESFDEWLQSARLAFGYAIAIFDPDKGLDFAPFCKRYLASALYTIRRQENRYRMRTTYGEKDLQYEIDKAHHDLGADAIFEREKTTQRLKIILSQLEAKEQTLIQWHYEEGKPLTALAQQWGLSKSQIYRQRDQLLNKIQEMWRKELKNK